MQDLKLSLFGLVAETVGARLVPGAATGAALDTACQAIADSVLQQPGPALICVGGFAAQRWQTLLARAARPGTAEPWLVVFADRASGPLQGRSVLVPLNDGSALAHEYFLLAVSADVSALICGVEQPPAASKPHDQCFMTFWSFESALVRSLLPELQAIAGRERPALRPALADAFGQHIPAAGANLLMESVVRRLFDELSQQHINRIRLERSLARSARLRSIGQMLSGVAHELNNPLQSILGFSTLLLDEPAIPPDHRADLQHIVAAAERARLIVQSVLQLARSEDERFVAVDLGELIAKTLVFMRSDLERADISVQIDVAPQLPPVTLKPFRIQQLLINLVSNATHALSGQSGRRSVRISATTTWDNRCELSVEDNGPGIPDQIQQQIFEPFFTTKQMGEGTGLGLSIVRTIVEEHQGSLRLVSTPGVGTTFRILLPIRHAASAEVPGRQALMGDGRVLVLDADAAVCAVMRRTLERAGYAVRAAGTLDAGLQALQCERFDAVLCAVFAPLSRLTGFYTAVAETAPDTLPRLIFTTSDATESATSAFLEQTGRPALIKPFRPDDLLKAVAHVIAPDAGPAL